MKGKIGMVTAHAVTNYGALLQSFAMQQVVEAMGYETEIIDYKANRFRRGIKFYWGLFPFFWIGYKERKEKEKSKQTESLDSLHIENKNGRKLRKLEFEQSKLRNIVTYHGYKALKAASKSCRAVLIGSDQMWLPGVSFGNYQSLRFVADGVRRISYATSLGVSQYPEYCHQSAADMWCGIDFLSVREDQGKEIIQKICPELDVNVVCDPTYLLTKAQWEEKIPYQQMSNEKYLLCYFLGNSEQQMKMAAEYAKTKGLKCYTILSDESHNSIDDKFADKVIISASVEDFINWIRGAECVITDSFHGLAFSVINERNFFIFYRKRSEVRAHRNARIDNILKMWGLEKRLILPERDIIPDLPAIEYDTIRQRVEAKREQSLDFLNKALTF